MLLHVHAQHFFPPFKCQVQLSVEFQTIMLHGANGEQLLSKNTQFDISWMWVEVNFFPDPLFYNQ